MSYLDMNDLSNYGVKKVARLMNEKMREEIEDSQRYYWRGTEPDLRDKTLWGQMDMPSGRGASFMTLSNNQATKSIMSSYVEDGEVEFGSDYMRIHVYRVGKHVAKVYGDPDDLNDMPLMNGEFTEAFWHFYDNVLHPLSDYPLLDDDDYYEREREAKSEAFESEWEYVVRGLEEYDDADDDWKAEVESKKYDIWYILDGGEENPVTGHYEEIEVSDDSAYVDGDDIRALLEHFNLVTSREEAGRYQWQGLVKVYVARPKTQEEKAMIEAMKYQEVFDFEGEQ